MILPATSFEGGMGVIDPFLTYWGKQIEIELTLRFYTVCSPIYESWICLWWFDFKLEPIFDTAPATSKNEACIKSGQNWPKNNRLAT